MPTVSRFFDKQTSVSQRTHDDGISPDTIIPNPGDHQMFNRYAYCRNNPVMAVDPSGYRPSVRQSIKYIGKHGWPAYDKRMKSRYGDDYLDQWPEDVRIRTLFARDSRGQDLGALGTNSQNRINRTQWADQYYRTRTIHPDLQAAMNRHKFSTPEGYFDDVRERYAYHEHGRKLEASTIVATVVAASLSWAGPEVAVPAAAAAYCVANWAQGEKSWQIAYGGNYGPSGASSPPQSTGDQSMETGGITIAGTKTGANVQGDQDLRCVPVALQNLLEISGGPLMPLGQFESLFPRKDFGLHGVFPDEFKEAIPGIFSLFERHGVSSMFMVDPISPESLDALSVDHNMIVTVLIGGTVAHTVTIAGRTGDLLTVLNPGGIFGVDGAVGSVSVGDMSSVLWSAVPVLATPMKK